MTSRKPRSQRATASTPATGSQRKTSVSARGSPGRAAPRPGARRRPWLVLAGAGLLVALAAGIAISRGSGLTFRSPAPPQVDLAHVEPQVSQRVLAALAAVAERPDDPAAWGELGMLYHAHNFFNEAAVSYRQASVLAPRDSRWPYLTGLALALTEPAEAVRALDQAVTLGVGGVAVHWHLGNLLAGLGEVERARAEMELALAQSPASAFALAGLGRVAVMQGRWDEAVERLEQSLALDAESAEVHTLLAQAYRQHGRTADAERMATLARTLEDQDPTSPPDPIFDAVVERGTSSPWLVRRALAMQSAGRLAEAEALFREAVAAAPGDPTALLGLGIVRQNQGDRAEAIELYQRALARNPDHVEALSNLGFALAQSGDYPAGAARLERALEIAPGDVAASLNLALVRMDQARPADAVALAEPVRRAHPNDVRAANTLAQALAAAGRFDDAAREWRASVTIQPAQEQVWATWSTAASAAGRHAEAIAILREGLTTLPTSVLIRGTLAWELATAPAADLRRGSEALQLAGDMVRAMPQFGQSYDILAVAQAETGDLAGAVASAEKALSLQPTSGAEAITEQIRARLELYRRGEVYRQER
jgi:tetratricopeptide (TPR) repeat protein